MTTFTFKSFKKNYFALFLSAFALFGIPQDAMAQSEEKLPSNPEALAEGEELFRSNCVVCHAVHEKVIGPALVNVTDRRPLPWLVNFIQNSQKMIQSGDEYAVNLYNEYGKTVMPSFDYFSEEQIKNILAYVEAESEITPAEENNTTEVGETPAPTANGGDVMPPSYLTFIFGGFFVVMVLVLSVMILMIVVLKKFLSR